MKKIMQTSDSRPETEELSYEMPRARTETPGYSLAGRRVIRTLHSAPGKTPPPMGVTVPPAAKTAPNAKTAAAAAKKPDPKKTAQNTKGRKPKVSINVVSADKTRMSNFKVTANGSAPDVPMAGFSNSGPAANPVVAVTDDEDKSKLSIGQWRSLLFSQPTAKHGQEFLAAFQSKDIDENGYYQVSEELMIDNAADRHKLGVQLMQAIPSVKAFTVLLKHYNEKTPEPLRTEIAAMLKSYGEVSRFSILVKLLYSNDLRVVQTAQALLTTALATMQANNGGNQGQGGPQDGRDARTPATPAPTTQLNSFVPALKRLLTSNDATVAQQAQALLDSIQALRPA